MKLIKRFLVLFLTISLITGCNNNDDKDKKVDDKDKVTENNKNDDNMTDDNTMLNDNENNDDVDREMHVSEDAEGKVESISEVKHSTVIVNDNNAYVAVELENASDNEVNDDVKDKITKEIKAVDSKVEDVYISSNPDFVNSMKDYGDRIEKGDPVEGFFDEFFDMTKRIFPDADGNINK